MSGPLPLSYVLPLRWSDDHGLGELSAYLRWLATEVSEVIVVDGSPRSLFERHAEQFRPHCRHLRPHSDLSFAYPKVDGVTTGVREASQELVVLADDDVRYGIPELRRISALLERVDLVRPQNFFRPLVWHARLDTARSLLNRVFSGDLQDPAADFPGTLALRRDTWTGIDGYDGDVLFENLELIRTVRAAGGIVISPLDLFVARRPPSTSHFLSQRVRQAYDDFALPLRMGTFLAIGPLALLAALTRRLGALAVGSLSLMAVAEIGRRRAGGARHFPISASLLAPAWVCERAVCAWFALGSRAFSGGVRYGSGRITRSATPIGVLRRRYRDVQLPTERGGGLPLGALSASKPISLCVPSQKGRVRERPHRHKAIVSRLKGISLPS